MRLKKRSSVDLPQPDGPMKAVTRCGAEREIDVLQRVVLAVIEIEVARGRPWPPPSGSTLEGSRPPGCSRYGHVAHFALLSSADDARADVQGKHGQGDEQGAAPGQLLPISIRALRRNC